MQSTYAHPLVSHGLQHEVAQTSTLRLPAYGFMTAAAISLNLWGWIFYGVWRLAF